MTPKTPATNLQTALKTTITLGIAVSGITFSTPAYGQTKLPETNTPSTAAADLYILPPQVADPEKLAPQTTTLPLNDTPTSHRTEWELRIWEALAATTNSPIFFNSTLKLDSEVIESLTRNNIYTVDQKASYLQLRNFQHQKTVTTTTTEPQTINGLEIQVSLTGLCFLPGTPADQQCTYTPGLVADRNSIDPQFLVPTRILPTSNLGDVVTPESLAAIQRPGFQRGAGGQEIGLDLYFPNSGAFAGNEQSQESDIHRQEEIEYAIVGTFSRVRQIVKANHTQAVIGRTIRGFTAFVGKENRPLNLAIQAGSQFLPEVIPELEGSENPVNTNINVILFQAANNNRLPANSFTIYSAGVGRAKSLTPDITSPSQVPKANYNSIWLGLSPVIERSFSQGETFYQPTGPQRAVVSGGEGGENENIEFVSAVNQELFSTETLEGSYTQVYLSFLSQDANLVSQEIYQEKINYYPHLSFTGNRTGLRDRLRYYAGAIVSEEVKVYLGADYTRNAGKGWNFRAGAVGYLNPDRDYYSQLWGNLAKNIRLARNANLAFGGGFNYAIDRETKIGDITSISPASEVALSARINWGRVSVGVTNFFGDILPNSYNDRLVIELAIRPLKTLSFSGYIAPVDETTSRSPVGASLSWRLENKYNSPSLSLSWQNQEYEYGEDPFGNDLLIKDNIFTVLFKVGSPGRPFGR